MNNEEKILQMLDALTNKVDVLAKKAESDLLEFRSEVNGCFDRVETQQRENTDIIKAIRHNQEHICAEIESLKTHTASAEALAEVKAEIVDTNLGVNELNNRLFTQAKEIGKLKLVK